MHRVTPSLCPTPCLVPTVGKKPFVLSHWSEIVPERWATLSWEKLEHELGRGSLPLVTVGHDQPLSYVTLEINVVLDKEVEGARLALSQGNKKKALLALKKKKYQEQLLEKTEQQLLTLEELTQSIEYALVEKQVVEGLKSGNEVLKEIHKELSVEAVERLMDDTADAIAYQNEIDDILSGQISTEDEEEILRELESLQREELEANLPAVPAEPLPISEPSIIQDLLEVPSHAPGKETEEEKVNKNTIEVVTKYEYEVKDESAIDRTNLRRVAAGIPMAAGFILVNELCERFAYFGGSTPFQNYVQNPPPTSPEDSAGMLDRGQSVATALQSFFTFFCYFTPVLGAVVADQYIGRYWTILVFSTVYMIGWLILTTTATPAAIASGAGFPGYIVSLIVIGVGTGGIKGIVSPLCADQYETTENYVREEKNGELVVVDYDLSIQHLYNWFYWCINVGALLGGIICPTLERYVSFWTAFLLPTCMFAVAIMVFVAGSRFYYKPPPTESVILKAYKVFRFARKQASLPENKEAKAKARSVMEFAKRQPALTNVVEWSESAKEQATWTDEFVDELRQTIMACRIFVPLSIYWVCYNQLSNNLLSQAGNMVRHGIPNDIMNNVDPIALIIFIPIVDRVLYPFLRKRNMNLFPQMRITIGFFLASLSMVYAAVVQHFMYQDPVFQATGTSSISVFVQIPCYALIAFSEIFASITSLEYAYTHAPKSMKSLISALSLWPNCVSSLIGLAISPSAHDPNMVWVYSGVAIGAFLCGCLYYYVFRHYDTMDHQDNLAKTTYDAAIPNRSPPAEHNDFGNTIS
ncbi:peptide transporter ptr2 [Apophysomyces sp. BC1021]|nr:peptide transporter ptr2 [Apophysomyces sp. BC1021]